MYIRKIGDEILLTPYHNDWVPLLESLGKFSPDFMEDIDEPPLQTRELF